MKQYLMNGYRYFNLLNLDVASGSIISALFFLRWYQLPVNSFAIIALFLAVWIIYTADRILDVKQLKDAAASSARHQFHQQNKSILVSLIIIALVLSCYLLYKLPPQILFNGICLSAIAFAYLFIHKRIMALKEFLISLIYVAGILLPVWTYKTIVLKDMIVVLPFWLIVITNLILFSKLDREEDLIDSRQSLATILTSDVLNTVLMLLLMAALIFSSNLLFSPNFKIGTMYLVMTFVLALVYFYRNKYPPEWLRMLGDSIFLIPICFIL